jgi:hypothetical protein
MRLLTRHSCQAIPLAVLLHPWRHVYVAPFFFCRVMRLHTVLCSTRAIREGSVVGGDDGAARQARSGARLVTGRRDRRVHAGLCGSEGASPYARPDPTCVTPSVLKQYKVPCLVSLARNSLLPTLAVFAGASAQGTYIGRWMLKSWTGSRWHICSRRAHRSAGRLISRFPGSSTFLLVVNLSIRLGVDFNSKCAFRIKYMQPFGATFDVHSADKL